MIWVVVFVIGVVWSGFGFWVVGRWVVGVFSMFSEGFSYLSGSLVFVFLVRVSMEVFLRWERTQRNVHGNGNVLTSIIFSNFVSANMRVSDIKLLGRSFTKITELVRGLCPGGCPMLLGPNRRWRC